MLGSLRFDIYITFRLFQPLIDTFTIYYLNQYFLEHMYKQAAKLHYPLLTRKTDV